MQLDHYTPSCNWRSLQKSLGDSKKIQKKTKKTPSIKPNKNKALKNNVKIKESSEAFFSFLKPGFCRQKSLSDEHIIQSEKETNNTQKTRFMNEVIFIYTYKSSIGRYIALDCEMVQVGPCDRKDRVLARISIVNYHGNIILDTFVKPKERVVDYKTWISGVTHSDLEKAPSFEEVQRKVSDLLKNRILIGHAIKNDLDVLFLSHPRKDIRDTSRFKPFKAYSKGRTPSLKRLAKEILNISIQDKTHSSVANIHHFFLTTNS
ncbi:hypothetical protein PNEG_02910 [Pneumocystis murina B123]|uniref:RNA exonuclease 4 n=1 Tax=Pneumocystis murina (strain B123) TaxID=1069680 RepID=M7P4H6_PNEMU|nr:hypothetical protein PNEG_02910 [Pneumocystis murina B123]EMR08735.1 hypothetical protein PNEG_02910 [Pneumocystis murina B123]